MEYRRFDDSFIVRLDPGDEIVDSMLKLAAAEGITLASISGMGAVNQVTLGVFCPQTKQYKANIFHADFEIVSLTGNLTTQNGRPNAHLHMAVGDNAGRVYGGHLNRAVVSATAEIVVRRMHGTVEREPNAQIGLNLLKFLD